MDKNQYDIFIEILRRLDKVFYLREVFKEISQTYKRKIIKLLEDEKSYNLLEILTP